MTKLKTPLLSFDAHGSVGDSVTFVKRRGVAIAERRPVLPYFQTLPTFHQRFLYGYYANLWTQQSDSIKLSYKTAGARYHLSAFPYWMKYHLSELPDIAGFFYLDEQTGVTSFDASNNLNNGTVTGALPSPGKIGYCRSFDGLLNRIVYLKSPSLNVLNKMTLVAWILPLSLGGGNFGRILWKGTFSLMVKSATALEFDFNVGASNKYTVTPNGVIKFGSWTHVAAGFDGANTFIYADTVKYTGTATAGPVDAHSAYDLYCGNLSAFNRGFHGLIDEVIIFNRALSLSDVSYVFKCHFP